MKPNYQHLSPLHSYSQFLFLLSLFWLGSSASLAFAGQSAEQKRAAKELRCLAQNIYFEARGEATEGQLAVAMVTMNRVNSRYFPNSICGVVWQKRQFSWTHDGKSDRPTDRRAWKLAKKIASYTYHRFSKLPARLRRALDITKGALHYYAPTLASPYWAEIHTVTREIGGHVFLDGRT